MMQNKELRITFNPEFACIAVINSAVFYYLHIKYTGVKRERVSQRVEVDCLPETILVWETCKDKGYVVLMERMAVEVQVVALNTHVGGNILQFLCAFPDLLRTIDSRGSLQRSNMAIHCEEMELNSDFEGGAASVYEAEEPVDIDLVLPGGMGLIKDAFMALHPSLALQALPLPLRQPSRSSFIPGCPPLLAFLSSGGGGSGGAAGGLKFTVADTCERIKEEFNFIQQQNHSQLPNRDLADLTNHKQKKYPMYKDNSSRPRLIESKRKPGDLESGDSIWRFYTSGDLDSRVLEFESGDFRCRVWRFLVSRDPGFKKCSTDAKGRQILYRYRSNLKDKCFVPPWQRVVSSQATMRLERSQEGDPISKNGAARVAFHLLLAVACIIIYYEMSYGLNVEMHKQLGAKGDYSNGESEGFIFSSINCCRTWSVRRFVSTIKLLKERDAVQIVVWSTKNEMIQLRGSEIHYVFAKLCRSAVSENKRLFLHSTEIAKRLNAIIVQLLPFLAQEHQQQVANAVERAKQVTMSELNAIIGQQQQQGLQQLLQQIHAQQLPHGAVVGGLPPAGLLGFAGAAAAAAAAGVPPHLAPPPHPAAAAAVQAQAQALLKPSDLQQHRSAAETPEDRKPIALTDERLRRSVSPPEKFRSRTPDLESDPKRRKEEKLGHIHSSRKTTPPVRFVSLNGPEEELFRLGNEDDFFAIKFYRYANTVQKMSFNYSPITGKHQNTKNPRNPAEKKLQIVSTDFDGGIRAEGAVSAGNRTAVVARYNNNMHNQRQ
ncbi:Protein groucho [Melipona quadrifasciata]|uniref:Protein groucho n=1 Tax=Melipona quadrifasciata TaxID=166423 RepID=A0A0N0BHT2_9HYME|nr:Protein groucho [Melipona quadrifasciata]